MSDILYKKDIIITSWKHISTSYYKFFTKTQKIEIIDVFTDPERTSEIHEIEESHYNEFVKLALSISNENEFEHAQESLWQTAYNRTKKAQEDNYPWEHTSDNFINVDKNYDW